MSGSLRSEIRRVRLIPRSIRRADSRFAARLNRSHAHPAADRAWVRLSHAADRGRLWFAIAAGLAIFGRRRAALRGVLSLAAASTVANLVGKQVFGGERQLLKDIPVGRRLAAQPTSASFPSGHSASAAAFATGVALEAPRAGLAIAPVAASVAYSRLHTGAHWLSDVVAGVGIGAGLALIGGLVVPPRPAPAPPVAHGPRVDLPASPTGEGVLVVVNPSSGRAVVRADPVRALTRRLPDATLLELDRVDDLDPAVDAALAGDAPPRILGVVGGDGTVARVAGIARRTGLPLLVVPGGTFNHFARAAGLDSAADAIDAVQAGTGVRTDAAELTFADESPVTVLNSASVGIYPGFVLERERREPAIGKWPAALVAAWKVLGRAEPIALEVDGRPMRVWTLFTSVGGSDPVTLAPLARHRLADGALGVRILRAGTRTGAVASLSFGRRTSAVLRTLRLLPEQIEAFDARELVVDVFPAPGRPHGFAHDGEVAEDPGAALPGADLLPAPRSYRTRIRVLPGELRVYARTRQADGSAVSSRGGR
ncbi:bifunctional phosphatase PAP2/diacylglycerol kinase family protein [Agromyces sp. SYSU T00194]|uniref:bifunctional phosphatase PAP2/diacylglycerol kinase family protein n=1 Tax=Agromyces chitinivorans TaxID=3158560 RepID=UPI0033959490